MLLLRCECCSNLTVYYHQNEPGGTNNEWTGFIPFIFQDCGDSTEFSLTFRGDKLFLAFRSSDDAQDWQDNLDMAFTDYSPPCNDEDGEVAVITGQVHRGIHDKVFGNEVLMETTKDVFSVLPSFYNAGYEIVVAGHSQGAAMGILYASWMAQLMPELDITVLALGAPRVGDAEFKESLETSLPNLAIFRVVYEEDIVARLPFRSSGYRHVGHLLYKFEHDDAKFKAYYQQTGGEGDYDGVDDYEWDIDVNIFDPLDSIQDHQFGEYRDSIVAAVEDPEQYWPKTFETIAAPECCWKLFGGCLRWC